MSKQLRLDVAQLTDVGRKRPHNEDNMAYVIPKDAQVMAKKGALFVVADGMGGHAAGEVASEIAVETISSAYYQDDNNEDMTASLLHAIKRANALIHQRAAENMMRSGMGTTCVAAALRGSTAYIANIGDSRAYMIRAGQVRQVSQDHSWVEEQVRAGLLTREQARSHAQRNVITRSLGTQSDVDVDIFTEQVFEGDTLLLCSDGLSGQITDDDLRTIIGKYTPQESVYRLVERANENGGPDNITAIVIRVVEPGWDPYPVPVGSREAIAETVTLGRVPSASLTMSPKIEDAMTQPMPPARLRSGPLPANEGPSFARPAFAPAQTKRPRFLWLFIAALTVLLLGVLGGGLYYFVRPMLFPTVDVDHTLSNARVQIEQAQKDVTAKDGFSALRVLSSAQGELRAIQPGGSLSSSQTKTLQLLQNTLVTTTQGAITAYNQQELISTCANMNSSPVSAGTTNTQPTSLAVVQSGNAVHDYALGADHNLYELDNRFNLVNKQSVSGVFMLAGAQDHVLALTEAVKGRTTSYNVNLLTPNAAGGLDSKDTYSLDTALNNGMLQPLLLTAWTTDMYVVLTSQTAPYSVTIINVPETNNKFGKPTSITVSISNKLMSMAAFPNHQLFLLDGSGNVQSLQFANTTQQPSSVVLPHPLADPLSANAKSFSFKMNVPVPSQQTSSSLTFSPSATQTIFLTTNLVNNVPRLYIVDSAEHRVIALQTASNSTSATASVTPTNQATQQTAKATATATVTATAAATATSNPVVASNGQPGASATMSLVQQYVSSDQVASVKGVATNPKIATVYLLNSTGQNAAGTNLVSVDVSQTNVCAS